MFSLFQNYLVQKASIQEKYIPYYLKWVSDCYLFLNIDNSDLLLAEQKQTFLEYLSQNCEDWQITQADNALRIYTCFLSSQKTTTDEKLSDIEKKWASVNMQMRKVLRLKHRSYSTEKTYLIWLKAFKKFVYKKTPSSLTALDIQNFLTSLALERKVSASTQNQALNAIIFFYRHVLKKEIGEKELNAVRAKQKVLSHLMCKFQNSFGS